MRRTSLANRPCTIARALDQLGDAWTLLILRDVFLGAHRFAELQADLGIAPNTLTSRLATLVRHGLLEQRSYRRRPARSEYVLTEKGEDALPVLLAFASFGGRWLAPHGLPLVPVDPATGRAVEPLLIDRLTGKPLKAGGVAVVAGPGAPRSLRARLTTPRVFEGRGTA
jgi:DNA-binding HxlR family transcriptional regulator